MKIALVTETYPPEVNGVAMTLEHLVQGLAHRGHEMEVVRPRQNRADAPAHTESIQETLYTGLPLPGYKGLHFGVTRPGTLEVHWKKTAPDLIHIATEGPLGWSALQAARRLEIPTVSSYHTNFHSYGKHYGYGMLMKPVLAWLRYIHNGTRLTFAPARDVADTLTGEGFLNVRLMGRGVDTQLFNPTRRSDELRKNWGATPDTPVAVYVGRLAGEKNIPCVLKAFDTMRKTLPELKLVLVGDGPEAEKLHTSRPDLIFAGMRRGEDLATHYASADAFLFASVTETFGNVVTEAMASGLPVLAYRYAAPARYVQDGISGRLAEFGNEAAFLTAARELATERDRWESMGEMARETAQGIAWNSVIEDYSRNISEVIHT